MTSEQAEQAVEAATRLLAMMAPLSLETICRALVTTLEECQVAVEAGNRQTAKRAYRRAENMAQLLKHYEVAARAAELTDEILDERQAPEEWHTLARELLLDSPG